MNNNLRIRYLAFASVIALSITGCGGGGGEGDNTANPGGPIMVNAFAYVQPIVASGTSETAEPSEVEPLVLSSTETEEPDSRL